MWPRFLSSFRTTAKSKPNKQNIAQGLSTRTFAVDDVEHAEGPLLAEQLALHITKRFCREVIALPEPKRMVVNPLKRFDRGSDSILVAAKFPAAQNVSRVHPLIDAVHMAFSEHRPLTLSPDSIWLTIAQGFSHHIQENAENLRHRLVRHKGRKELFERVEGDRLSDFEGAIAGFSAQIRKASDPVLHESLICDFSTTTPEIRTASEVVLMDAFASYFAYRMQCICGIPKVTVTGTAQDWSRIRDRIGVLETFGLSWWTDRVRPILDQFVATAEGEPDVEFWQAI